MASLIKRGSNYYLQDRMADEYGQRSLWGLADRQ